MNTLPPAVKDKRGQRFGRLTVQEFVCIEKRRSYWSCLCDCGNTKIVTGSNLGCGHTKSCGCLTVETCRSLGSKTQGSIPQSETRKRLLSIWRGMIDRCNKPHFDTYRLYGAKGISVCKEWLHDFDTFYLWAVDNGYDKDLSIERKDVNGNYEPKNCTWITRGEQTKNRTTSRHHWAFGEKKCLSDWVRDPRCVVSVPTINNRLKNGWGFEAAITTPGMSKSEASIVGWSKQRHNKT